MPGFGTQLSEASARQLLAGQGGGGNQTNDPLGLGMDWHYYPEWAATYVANMTQIGYNEIDAREALNYQKENDEKNRQYDYWAAEKDYQQAIQVQKIASGAYAQAAAAGAEADMYDADQALRAAQEQAAASRYAADKALEGLKISEENKIKIAAANLNLEAKRIAAEEMKAPSDWREQAGYLRSMGMTRADISPTAIQQAGQALSPVAPELAPTTTPAAAPSQAIVGEAGPELATATPQGTQVQPIQRESAWWLRKQGVQGMQGGGIVGYDPFAYGQYKDVSSKNAGITSQWRQQTNLKRLMAGQPMYVQEPGAKGYYYDPFAEMKAALTPTSLAGAGGVVPSGGIAGAGAAGTTTPVAGEGTTEGEPPYLGMLREGAYVPLYQAWGGPRTKPEVGMNIPIKMPHEINYGDFVRLTPTEQQMAFADWQALGMAPDTALRIMQSSAMRGTAQAATAYG